jgi:hypothetical protein
VAFTRRAIELSADMPLLRQYWCSALDALTPGDGM